MFQFKKILVPLDGSSLAERALDPAFAIARAMSTRLMLLRVTPPVQWIGESIEVAELFHKVEARYWEEAELYLKSVRAQFQDPGVPVQIETASGPVAESIIDCAERESVDLIVMSSHGRSGISRWIYGSVAEKVLRGARCATLIVRGQQGNYRGAKTLSTHHPVRETVAPGLDREQEYVHARDAVRTTTRSAAASLQPGQLRV